jgi:capsular exopolysaccharide synthesis family protein
VDLTDIRTAMRRHWVVAVAGLAFWLAVGGALAFVPAPEYRSAATVIVTLSPDGATDAVQFAGFEIPSLVATIESRTFIAEVRRTLPPAPARASVGVTAEAVPGTGILHIEVQSADRSATAPWATALARAATRSPDGNVLKLRVLDAAVGAVPVAASRLPILLSAMTIGLLTAVLASVVAFRVHRALDVVEEIDRRLELPVLGQLPGSRALRADCSFPLNPRETPPEVLEAFKLLRTSVEIAAADQPAGVIAVTSWSDGEGSSTVVAGLATAIAEGGREVLAVDADLRRPILHERLGVRFGEGLADVGRRELEPLIIPTAVDGLSFLPAGVPTRHPADILASSLEGVLAFARDRGRSVLLDAPPFHGLAETMVILSAVDGVIVVVDARRPRLPEVESMVLRMRGAGVPVIGVVLNRVPRARMRRASATYVPARPAARPRRVGPLGVVDGPSRDTAARERTATHRGA